MGDLRRKLSVLLVLAALSAPAIAQSPKDGPGGKSAAEVAQQALDAGMKAYGVGKFDEAHRAFDAAMRGGLSNDQMARLLYYRGLTYRKQNKSAMAISDLNGALWIKGGLSEAERQDAIKSRALAYNAAGIANVPPVPQSAYAQAPSIPGSGQRGTTQQTAMASGGGVPPPAATVSSAPAAPAPQASSGGVAGFFSNLFGGGLFGGGSDSGEVTTASINQPAPSAVESGWGGTTQVNAAPPPAHAHQSAAQFVTQVAAVDNSAPAASGGAYRLQVASVRSRSEAEALAGLVVGRHGDHLGGRQPEVSEAVIGSMGTFYRVRLGPYASAKEPERLCDVLRSDGFDCLIVTQ